MNWYLDVLRKYAVFDGRARRQEFWMFVLINFIISSVLGSIGSQITFFSVLAGLYGLAVLVPSIAVGIRRMHDIGKPGIWILINLVPCVGFIWYLILCCKEGDPGTNAYGPNPKGDSGANPYGPNQY